MRPPFEAKTFCECFLDEFDNLDSIIQQLENDNVFSAINNESIGANKINIYFHARVRLIDNHYYFWLTNDERRRILPLIRKGKERVIDK